MTLKVVMILRHDIPIKDYERARFTFLDLCRIRWYSTEVRMALLNSFNFKFTCIVLSFTT